MLECRFAFPLCHPGFPVARLLLATAVGMWGAHATAQDTSAWTASGFGSFGVTSQHGAEGWGLRRDSAQPGAGSQLDASQDTRLGLQLNWRDDDAWDAVLQAVAFRRPSGTPWRERFQWAYLGYKPLPDLSLRLGRTSPDMFLYANSRHVGYALPWVRPPADFYGFAPAASVDGIDVQQRWRSGGALWSARAAAGSFHVSSADADGRKYPIRGHRVASLSIQREDEGLLLKVTFLDTWARTDPPPELSTLRDGLTQLTALPVPEGSLQALQKNLWTQGTVRYLALSGQWDSGRWTTIGELSDLAMPGSAISARRAYTSVGYRVHRLSYYLLASRVLPERPAAVAPDVQGPLTPLLGAAGAAQAQQLVDAAAAAGARARYDQSTLGLGLRWDCCSQGALKLQWDRFHVHPYGSAGWAGGGVGGARGSMLSLAFDFVWGQ